MKGHLGVILRWTGPISGDPLFKTLRSCWLQENDSSKQELSVHEMSNRRTIYGFFARRWYGRSGTLSVYRYPTYYISKPLMVNRLSSTSIPKAIVLFSHNSSDAFPFEKHELAEEYPPKMHEKESALGYFCML